MKKSALLLSVVLLAFSASAQADGIGMSVTSVSVSSFQFSMSTPSLFPMPNAGLLLIPAAVGIVSPAVMLFPTASPLMVVNSAALLAGSMSVQPHPAAGLLATQIMMTTAGHDVALAIMANMN